MKIDKNLLKQFWKQCTRNNLLEKELRYTEIVLLRPFNLYLHSCSLFTHCERVTNTSLLF